MSASEALGEQFAMMRPSELIKHSHQTHMYEAKIGVIADSISQHGYRAARAQGNKAPITLDHTARMGGPTLTEGNHRVHAMGRIGYDRPVKVRVVGAP